MDSPEKGKTPDISDLDSLKQFIESLKGEGLTNEKITAIFKNAESFAQTQLDHDSLSATVFAINFSLTLISELDKEMILKIRSSADNSILFQKPLNKPAHTPPSRLSYLHEQLSYLEDKEDESVLMGKLEKHLLDAGADPELMYEAFDEPDDLVYTLVDEDELVDTTYLENLASSTNLRDAFINFKGGDYEKFARETGKWLGAGLDKVMEDLTTNKYLMNQEMGN